MNFVVNTGSQQRDHEELNRYQQHYRAQGLELYAQPLPTGGYQVTIAPPQQAAPQAPPAQVAAPQYAPAAPQYAPPGPPGYAPPGPPQYAPPGPPQYGAPQAPQAPQGGYGAPQGGYGAPQAPQGGYGAPQGGYGAPAAPTTSPNAYAASASPAAAPPTGGMSYAMAGGGAMAAGATAGAIAPPLSSQRVAYLKKVYGLLGAAAFIAVFAGYASLTFGPTTTMTSPEGATVEVPLLAALMLGNRIVQLGAFGLLFVSTLAASAVSKVRVVNVVALMGVALLMGIELSDMVFVAQYYAGLGDTLSNNPVRDTMVMVMCVFAGITGYIFITRKDFSWMSSILSMGVMVIFGACLLTFVFKTEVFSLAVASAGALLSIGMLLYVTSYIFRNSEMDDAVGDALALLVQLRNLFMFLLRILMSARR
ncbi:MAG TPA: Bax inhibitor-1 family protein [Polyangiaceae bacterium]|nr:Bax inhibitor-1 family protein [Polyangiaceae bacterium]